MSHHWHSNTQSANRLHPGTPPGPAGTPITEADVPTYQYACTACGHELEAVQSFTDEPLTQCPACEGRLRKLYSAVGIVFKGSGFYRTDSRAAASASKATDKKEAASTVTAANSGAASSSAASSATPSAGSSSSSGSSPSGSSSTSSSSGGASSSSTSTSSSS